MEEHDIPTDELRLAEVSALVDGELTGDREVALRAALETDPVLQSEIEALRILDEFLTSAPEWNPHPSRIAAVRLGVLDRVEKDLAQSRSLFDQFSDFWRRKGIAATCTVAGVLFGYVLMGGLKTAEPVPLKAPMVAERFVTASLLAPEQAEVFGRMAAVSADLDEGR